MSDWPGGFVNVQSTVIGSTGSTSVASDVASSVASTFGAGAWPTANRALYYPFWVEEACLAQKMGVWVTTQSGNLDVGIYDEKGTRLVSMGSTAVGAAGLQVLDIADTWLAPGTYFAAMCVDTTAAFFERTGSVSTNGLRMCGVRQQDVGAVTLPSPATFAVLASNYLTVLSIQCAAVL